MLGYGLKPNRVNTSDPRLRRKALTPNTSAAHLVLADHDGQVVGNQAKLLLQRFVGRPQLRQLRLCLLCTLLCCRRLLVQLSKLRFE
jgi:hypothetical protein